MKYLFAAYTITWIVLFIYLLSISKRVKDVKKELKSLTERVKK